MNGSIALGLVMLAGAVIGPTAVSRLYAQNEAPGRTLSSILGPSTGLTLSKGFLPRRATSTAILLDCADTSHCSRSYRMKKCAD